MSKHRKIQVLCAGLPKWCVKEGAVVYVCYFRERSGNIDEQNLRCRCRICAFFARIHNEEWVEVGGGGFDCSCWFVCRTPGWISTKLSVDAFTPEVGGID